MQLKINLHSHYKDEKIKENIKYNFFQLLNEAKKLNFDALAITPHDKLFIKEEFLNDGQESDILIIPGIEKTIEKSHIVILNPNKDIEQIQSFDELKIYKKNNPQIFIIAPHPFFYFYSVGKKLEKNIEIFDAIELSYFYTPKINFNKKAEKIAKKYNIPFIATSDTHFLKNLNKSYIIVNCLKKEINNIFQAIKNFNFQNFNQSLTLKELISDFLKLNFN